MGSIGHLDRVFKGILHTLLHRNGKIREAGLNLLKEIYIRVGDNCESIVKRLKKLRPVLKKDIKTTLNSLSKLEDSQHYRIFPKSVTIDHEEPTPTPKLK